MSRQQLDEEAVFDVARQIDSPAGRTDYLDQVCAGDQALRERVQALLQAYEDEQEFLKSRPGQASTLDRAPVTESAGQQIGRYKLLQQIGEGGFGVVYMAEQFRPVRRKVALKVIKPGMDTGAVVARFEAERQALAMMDHPNIARVLDGGATENERPYFVMELVKGVPLTEYCDKNQLSTRGRLELFATVCQAIQHAHQKGVIHRDIKPSNILVTLHDGQPVVKVIDFGVARAINQQLTERTLFTAYGQMVGTPQYMSPEQAEMSGLDVDTRSDIYSLGVLLYELLTGATPLDADKLRTAGYAEMQRMIQEDEPPKPSTRLSKSGGRGTVIAKDRRESPDRLHKLLRGDLDWIVMKSLDKDRNRRYDTAKGLLNDIDRHLSGEPVAAGPPTAAYRIQKFVGRNRAAMLAGGLVALSLVIGLLAAVSGAIRANRASDVAQREAGRAKLTWGVVTDLLESATPTVERGAEFTVREMLDELVEGLDDNLPPDVKGNILLTTGKTYRQLLLHDQASDVLARALPLLKESFGEEHPKVADCLLALSIATKDVKLAREALRIRRAMGTRDEALADTLQWMCWHLTNGDGGHLLDEAEVFGREAMEVLNECPAPVDPLIAAKAREHIGYCLGAQQRPHDALPFLKDAIDLYEALPMQSADLGFVYSMLGQNRAALGDLDEGIPCARRAMRIFEACGMPDGMMYKRLAQMLEANGDYEEAETQYARAAEVYAQRRKDAADEWHSKCRGLMLRQAQGDFATARFGFDQLQRQTARTANLSYAGEAALDETSLAVADEYLQRLRTELAGLEASLDDLDGKVPSHTQRLELIKLATAIAKQSQVSKADCEVAIQAVEVVFNAQYSWTGIIDSANSSLVHALARSGQLEAGIEALRGMSLKYSSGELSSPIIDYRLAERAVVEELRRQKRLDEVERVYRDGLAKRNEELPANHADIAFTQQKLAALLAEQERYDEAEALLLSGYELLKDHPITPAVRVEELVQQVVDLYRAWGRADKAARWREGT